MYAEETAVPTSNLQRLRQYDANRAHKEPEAVAAAGSGCEHAKLDESQSEDRPATHLMQGNGGVVSGEKAAGECTLEKDCEDLQEGNQDQDFMECTGPGDCGMGQKRPPTFSASPLKGAIASKDMLELAGRKGGPSESELDR